MTVTLLAGTVARVILRQYRKLTVNIILLSHVVHADFSLTPQQVVFLYVLYRVILSVLDPRKCEYLKDYSLDFEYAYMTTYLAS